ncbi:MAG: SDR family oxidoreductase [Syntrophorhabdaceae bacterium]
MKDNARRSHDERSESAVNAAKCCHRPLDHLRAYMASKHGVIGLTKTAVLEYAKEGIRVNALCPGAINTPMIDEAEILYPQVREFLTSMHPIGRLGEAEEIANAVVWLCSDLSSFVTGHSLVIDGALTAQ